MGAETASRWRYDGQLGAQDGQLGSILEAIVAHLGHLGTNFNENVEKTKTLQKPSFFKGFWGSGGSICSHLEAMLGYVGASWRLDGLCWSNLALCCAILATRCDLRAPG